MVQSLWLRIISNSIRDVAFSFEVTTKSVASMSISWVHGDFGCVLDITYSTEHAHDWTIILCLLIHSKGFFSHALAFQILRPPLVQSRFTSRHNKVLQSFRHIKLCKHSWYLLLMCSRLNIVLNSQINFISLFIVLSHRIMSRLQINSIKFLCYVNCIVPFATSLMKFAKQVVATWFFVKSFCIIHHVELDGNHSQASFEFLFIFRFTSCSGASCKTHVA